MTATLVISYIMYATALHIGVLQNSTNFAELVALWRNTFVILTELVINSQSWGFLSHVE
ncbi:uncharacterized protein J3R85_013679 [Psidium guajava]|nr:uncharacterized protein J3R85_013679 [Psidium guajava]